MSSSIRKVASFLGKSVTDDQVKQLVKHFDIDHFRTYYEANRRQDSLPGITNKGEQPFIRKGTVFQYKRKIF